VSDDPWHEARERMVRGQLQSRDIVDRRVLEAMRRVPRHSFVPVRWRDQAYDDHPLPIGFEQTISQPYIVALMTELARVQPGDRVLEIGTGSGYQTAVLAELGAEVHSIEVVERLSLEAAATLSRLGYGSVQVRSGDGHRGWPEHAPFAAVVVTAAPPSIPEPLKQQLAIGGRLVVPVGRSWQDLVVVLRTGSGFTERTVLPVRFVPMVGEAQVG
jgi:protein-L-isoaspartate(D-aspartate) O-methyltransferase